MAISKACLSILYIVVSVTVSKSSQSRSWLAAVTDSKPVICENRTAPFQLSMESRRLAFLKTLTVLELEWGSPRWGSTEHEHSPNPAALTFRIR